MTAGLAGAAPRRVTHVQGDRKAGIGAGGADVIRFGSAMRQAW